MRLEFMPQKGAVGGDRLTWDLSVNLVGKLLAHSEWLAKGSSNQARQPPRPGAEQGPQPVTYEI